MQIIKKTSIIRNSIYQLLLRLLNVNLLYKLYIFCLHFHVFSSCCPMCTLPILYNITLSNVQIICRNNAL